MKLSLVIPCYNEAKNIPLLIDRCAEVVKENDVEVILVDNGSSDTTPDVLSSLLPQYSNIRSVRVEINQGYGYGILAGLRTAKGNILAWTHADMQTDPADVLKGLQFFTQKNHDIFVKGRRYGRPLADTFFTVGMSIFESLLMQCRLWDINAQPTMFTRIFFETWQNPPHDFSLDLYAYYEARRQKLSVYRFPVRFGERAHGTSHWNVNWQAKWKFIQRTLQYSFQLKKRTS